MVSHCIYLVSSLGNLSIIFYTNISLDMEGTCTYIWSNSMIIIETVKDDQWCNWDLRLIVKWAIRIRIKCSLDSRNSLCFRNANLRNHWGSAVYYCFSMTIHPYAPESTLNVFTRQGNGWILRPIKDELPRHRLPVQGLGIQPNHVVQRVLGSSGCSFKIRAAHNHNGVP